MHGAFYIPQSITVFDCSNSLKKLSQLFLPDSWYIFYWPSVIFCPWQQLAVCLSYDLFEECRHLMSVLHRAPDIVLWSCSLALLSPEPGTRISCWEHRLPCLRLPLRVGLRSGFRPRASATKLSSRSQVALRFKTCLVTVNLWLFSRVLTKLILFALFFSISVEEWAPEANLLWYFHCWPTFLLF